MRRRNPPQANSDRAREIEKYQKPLPLAAIYAVCAAVYCVLVSLIFAALVYGSMVNPTAIVTTIFSVVAFVPTVVILLAWFLRPNDPISSYLASLVYLWRSPLTVSADSCTFKTLLTGSDSLCIKLAFYYPARNHTNLVRERLYTYVQSALATEFAARKYMPSPDEINRVLDAPLEAVAAEFDIPVLYSETQEVYSANEDGAAPVQYLNTGT